MSVYKRKAPLADDAETGSFDGSLPPSMLCNYGYQVTPSPLAPDLDYLRKMSLYEDEPSNPRMMKDVLEIGILKEVF